MRVVTGVGLKGAGAVAGTLLKVGAGAGLKGAGAGALYYQQVQISGDA